MFLQVSTVISFSLAALHISKSYVLQLTEFLMSSGSNLTSAVTQLPQ